MIIFSPSGSGKTLVAAYVCFDVLQNVSSDIQRAKVYFIVERIHIVDQQAMYLQRNLQGYQVGQITGDDDEKTSLSALSETNDIVVMTPMVLVNALKIEPDVLFRNVSLLVLDECHHTDKDHPYMQIMDAYLKQKLKGNGQTSLPRVLGMSATLGLGPRITAVQAQHHVLTLCANLDTTDLLLVTKHTDVLYRHVPHPDSKMLLSVEQRKRDLFQDEVSKIMKHLQSKSQLPEVSFPAGSDQYKSKISQHRGFLESNRMHKELIYAKALALFNTALQIYENFRKEDALEYIDKEIAGAVTPGGDSELIRKTKELKKDVTNYLDRLERFHRNRVQSWSL